MSRNEFNCSLLIEDADNKLTGVVPKGLCTMNLNELFFTDGSDNITNVDTTYNELYGNKTNSRTLKATTSSLSTHLSLRRHIQQARDADPATERDGCTSIACPAGYKSQATNTKDGVFPCEMCENESLNPYLGSNTCLDVKEDHVLKLFYNATNGESWIGATNWGDVNVGNCDKEGVTCNADGEVTAINLHKQGLSGTIPAELGFLPKLTSLDFSYNSIEGQLPADLRFAPLVLLDVAENKLTGYVPRGLCQKEGINGNGEGGIFTCDTISCQSGFFSSTGRAAPGLEGEKCQQCSGNVDFVLGIIKCSAVKNIENGITPFGLVGEIGIAILGLSIIFGLYWVWRRSKISRDYIKDRAYNIHGPGQSNLVHQSSGGFSHPESEVDETDPLGGMDGLGRGSLTRMEIKVKDEWSSGKETQKEVWLDVPKIS